MQTTPTEERGDPLACKTEIRGLAVRDDVEVRKISREVRAVSPDLGREYSVDSGVTEPQSDLFRPLNSAIHGSCRKIPIKSASNDVTAPYSSCLEELDRTMVKVRAVDDERIGNPHSGWQTTRIYRNSVALGCNPGQCR